jgi:sphingomyelin phosphodiesterase
VIQGTGMGLSYQDVVTMLIVHSANWFSYINLSHPDTSGMLRFLTDELQDAEDKGDRGMSQCSLQVLRLLTFPPVWIMGHVLSGWDGSNALEAPSNLCGCHALITRYSDELISSV